jgi:hypothetical protein
MLKELHSNRALSSMNPMVIAPSRFPAIKLCSLLKYAKQFTLTVGHPDERPGCIKDGD